MFTGDVNNTVLHVPVNSNTHTNTASTPYLLSQQLEGSFLSACIIFSKESKEHVDKQNILYLLIGSSDWLSRQHGPAPTGFRFSHLWQQASKPSSQHPHCVSVGIRMQSYYTLEGLSQSHRMAMNFKCRIRAYREAGTWEGVSWVLIWFFNFFFFFSHKQLWQHLVSREDALLML